MTSFDDDPLARETLRATVLLAVALLLPGCGGDAVGPSWDPEGPAVQIDQSSYHAAYLDGEGSHRRYGFELVARYTNLTESPVFLGRCQPDSPQPMCTVEGIGFKSAYSGIISCVGHENHFRLMPGKSRVDTFLITGPQLWSSDGEAWGFLYGEFRLRYWVGFCEGECAEIVPDSLTVSDPFMVTVDGWPFPLEE